jgi:hypothetical protein
VNGTHRASDEYVDEGNEKHRGKRLVENLQGKNCILCPLLKK